MNVVLIVEDEILEREFLSISVRDELSPEDKIIVCERGDEAISLAKQHRPNIIFMDLMIPEVDGLSAIKEIRKFLPNSAITILSAYSDFAYAQKAIRLNVFEYLLKPVKPTELKKTIRKMLQSTEKMNVIQTKKQVEQNSQTNNNQPEFIKQAINHIKKHYREKLTLEKVAGQVYVNPKYFSHVFKREMDISFTDYIIQLRIQYACKLLETTNYKAYRISSECGFTDPSYFSRVFSKEMDMTPQAYRKYVRSLGENNQWANNNMDNSSQDLNEMYIFQH